MFLKAQIIKAISINNTVKLPLSYWFFVCLRFVLTLLPQRGYIHPDEYFQNVEVIAGDIFPIDVSRTWEFDPRFPIRNIFIPKMIFGPPLHLIRLVNPFFKYYLDINLRTPYYLLVAPRLCICILSFINDYCLYKMCVLYGQNFRNRLRIFASSYVVLVYCCRGFSNAFEMIFFSILLLVVSECMLRSDKVIHHDEFLRDKYSKAQTPVERVKLYKLKTHLPAHSLSRVALIASITVTGIFNRPTFVGFAFPPLFFWLHRGLGSRYIGFKDFHHRMFCLIVCGIPPALLLIVIDSSYYGYLTLGEIESLKISWDWWVVTPLNFVRYNLDPGNLTSHGVHSRWMHATVNVLLLYNVLGALALITLSTNVYRFVRGHYRKLPRIQSITGLMLFSLVVPVGLLSLFPHQEARFIIPSLVPLVYLYGNYLYSNEADSACTKRLKSTLLCLWYILNLILTIFFGFIHQGGIYSFTKDLHYEIRMSHGVHTHVITTHSYSLPTYLLQLESTSRLWRDGSTGHRYKLAKQTFIYKYGSLPIDALLIKIDEVLSGAEMLLHEAKRNYKFYIASPCSLESQLRSAARHYYYFDLIEENSIYPHFCTEAYPKFPTSHDQNCFRDSDLKSNASYKVNLGISERLSCYLKQFCLKIYSVRAKHYDLPRTLSVS